MITTIVSFILVLGVLVFAHEFGHFIFAKKSDVRVEEFALGFGPKLFSRTRGETTYSIRAIPLGGFCNMTGEFPPDEDASEEEINVYQETKEKGRTFNQKSLWKKFLVLFMGPFMNFLLAGILFVLIFTVFGIPVDSSQTTIIGELIPEKPASEAGLKPGDRVIFVNGEKVEEWGEMSSLIDSSVKKEITLVVQRADKELKFSLTPEYSKQSQKGVIGIYPKMIRERVGIFKAIKYGVLQTWHAMSAIIMGFVQMITQTSAADVGGPIMIANIIGQAARVGMANLLNWMAIISINLGIINLLPFPALDGGRIVFVLIEAVRGRPIAPEKEGFVHFVGFILLMILMVFVVYKDIVRSIF
jgi:regulator of sigma E protease